MNERKWSTASVQPLGLMKPSLLQHQEYCTIPRTSDIGNSLMRHSGAAGNVGCLYHSCFRSGTWLSWRTAGRVSIDATDGRHLSLA